MNVVITGASRGFGYAIAEQFAAAGYTLHLCARDQERLKQSAATLKGQFPGVAVQVYAADLSDEKAVKSLAKKLLDEAGTIDILVNNAGSFVPGSVYNEPEGALKQMIDLNLFSAYHLTRALVPSMISRRQGHIFNMCSIASIQAYPNGGAYSISKFALLGFSKNLREEMKPFQVKVTAVLPGAAYTDSWKGSGIEPGRIMEAKDIARMVYQATLLSPQACVEEIVLRPQLGDL
jgi:short-subunit dehydrogenase